MLAVRCSRRQTRTAMTGPASPTTSARGKRKFQSALKQSHVKRTVNAWKAVTEQMARVFLSYAREDVETARKLAGVLADAGQTVWWDRHLHGGANFSSEIERELKDA